MGFIDDQQRVSRVESRLLEKEPAIVGSENVIEITDPDIVKREGSTCDFVRADLRFASGGSQCFHVVWLRVIEIKLRQSALWPALSASGEISATVAHAVERVIDAMFRFIPHLPETQRC